MKIPSFAMLVALPLAGCAATAPPGILPAFNPSDPTLGIEKTHYHAVIVDYSHRNPVDPQDWRRLNNDLSPAKGEAGS